MTHLADACALIAFFGSAEPERVMPQSAALMRTEEICVLPITVWEITRKVALGKLPMLQTGMLAELLRRSEFRPMPFGWDDAEAANQLPDHHRDPMDRMLIATALRSNLPVITIDRVFAVYGVRTVW